MLVVALSLLSLTSGLLREEPKQNPVARVVELIRDLKSKIEADGQAEQRVYDKFACWCEETTARKAAAIESAKQTIAELSKSIAELNGRLGSSTAERAQLNKDIASTQESIKKAEEMRSEENAEYLKTKAALEQAISNLNKAIGVLGKLPQQSRKGYIDAEEDHSGTAEEGLMETNVLTIAAGVRTAMQIYAKNNGNDGTDMSAVSHFLNDPASFVSTKVSSPHKGTYNTQSTVIMGILQDMYDSMRRDLQSTIDEENEKKSQFDDLHATKTKDLGLLQATLVKKNKENGDETKDLAEDEQEREETQAQLDTDEAFFETTKESCKAKADEWAERSRLRTEELAGIGQAIDILTASDATAIFNSADSTFVQLSMSVQGDSRTRAYKILKQTATKASSVHLAMIAATLSTTGHFDEVIADIDQMIAALRDEETADVEHRDWCQTERNNANSKNEVLEYDMGQLNSKVQRLEAKQGELNTEIQNTQSEMNTLTGEMQTALDNRNSENNAFKQALQDDTDAVALIGQAIQALSKFYSNNGLALVAKKKHHHKKAEPEYSENPDTAPETFSAPYGGRKSENTGIVAILGMIKEDLEKEMAKSQADEAAALAAYRKLNDESTASMNAMEAKKTSLEQQVADAGQEISDTQAVHSDTSDSKDATDDYLAELKPNCDWIMRTFGDRRNQRKDEIEGLEKAKSVLAGATPGEEAAARLIAKASVTGKKHESVEDKLDELSAVESRFERSFLQRTP